MSLCILSRHSEALRVHFETRRLISFYYFLLFLYRKYRVQRPSGTRTLAVSRPKELLSQPGARTTNSPNQRTVTFLFRGDRSAPASVQYALDPYLANIPSPLSPLTISCGSTLSILNGNRITGMARWLPVDVCRPLGGAELN